MLNDDSYDHMSNNTVLRQIYRVLNQVNNLVFYYSGGQECMYSKSPCSNYKNENLKIKRIYNYIIYYI